MIKFYQPSQFMKPSSAFSDPHGSGTGYDVFKAYLKRLSLLLVFLGGLSLSHATNAQSQFTHDFSTPAALSGQTPSWPWNTTATVNIGGVEYELTGMINSSWENKVNGGANNSASLHFSTASTTQAIIKRKDGQRFKFYGLWLSYDCFGGAYTPPHLTVTYTGSSLAQEKFNERNQQGLVLSKDVEVSSVTLYFSGLHTLYLDNLVVGPSGTALSSNANLSNLTLSGTTLSPAFNASTANYTASVANTVASVTVTPTKADANATVSINGAVLASGVTSRVVNLNVGANTITVLATAQNGSTKTYTVTVTRAAAPIPAAPSTPDLVSASDSGQSNTDNITNDNTPTFNGTATPNTTVKLYASGTLVGTSTADGAGNWSVTTSSQPDGTYTFTAIAVDGAGNQSPASASLSVTIDTTAPNTTITSNPSTLTNSTSVNFSFTSTEAGNNFQGSVNGSPFTSVTSLLTVSGLSDGFYMLQVRAVDVAGNVDPTPAFYNWTVDTTAPVVTNITRLNPATATTNASTVTYQVSFSESVTGISPDDFTLVGTGTAIGRIAILSGSGARYGVTVDGISGGGTLRLDMKAGTNITDIAGNLISGGYSSGQVYTVATTPLTASITSLTSVSCNGGSDGQATVTASGGLAPYTYSWSAGGRTQATATGLAAGAYTVTVTDAMGQTASAVATVTQPAALQASTSKTDVSRRGGSDGAAAVVVTGGTAPYTYTWSPSGGTGATASGLPAGTYTVVVTDANQCTVTRNLTISEPANIAPVASNDRYSVNRGQSITVPAPGLLGNDTDAENAPLTAVLVTGTANGTLILNANGSFTYSHNGSGSTADSFSYRASDGAAQSNTATVTISVLTPSTTVASINLLDRSPTNVNSLRFAVTFATAVTGVDASDFTLATTGTAVGTIASVTGSGTTYTVQVNSVSGDGTLRLDFTGLNGVTPNVSAAYTSGEVYTIDTTSPVITSLSVPANATYRAGQQLDFTINVSEAVIVEIQNGTPTLGLTIGAVSRQAVYLAGSGSSALSFRYTVQPGNLDMNGITLGTLALNGGTITDAIGNAAVLSLNGVPSTANVLVDAVAPTLQVVTIASSNSDATKAKVGDVVTLRLEASEPIAQPAVMIAGLPAAVTAATTTAYTATYTLTAADAEGTVPFTINFRDLAGNTGIAVSATTNASSVTFDKTAPTGTLAINGGAAYTSSPSVVLSMTANDALTGVAGMRFSNDNLTWSAWQPFGASQPWTLPAGNGNRTVYAQLRDGAGNTGAAEAQIILDNVPLTLTLSSTVGPATNTSFEVLFTFSKAVTGFTTADLTLVNAAASNLMTVDNKVYKATITPASEGEIRVGVAAGVSVDVAGNLNAASNTITTLYDSTRPVAALATTAPNPTNRGFEVSITFSEKVTGFNLQGIAVTNATLSGLATDDDQTFTVQVTPSTNGAVTLSIPAGEAQDAAGNGNLASAVLSRTFNATRPTVALSTNAASPTNATFTLIIRFSKEVSGFALEDVEVSNGLASAFSSESAQVYTALITPQADGEVIVNVKENVALDNAGNGNEAATAFRLLFDQARPTVALASAAPASVNGAFDMTITFSEPVTGFAGAGITVTNGTVSSLTALSASEYAVRITPLADGDVKVQVKDHAARDAAGNGNLASTELTRNYDDTMPQVTVATTASSPVNTAFTAQFTFTEEVAGFDLSDITTTNGAVSDFVKVTATAYTALITPASDGEVTVAVAAGKAKDAAGNANLASNVLKMTFDTARPTVLLASAAPPVVNAPLSVTFSFSKDVTGFGIGDISITNGTAADFALVNPKTYTVQVIPAAEGEVIVAVPADAARDGAGNGSASSNTLTRLYDTTRPTVVVRTSASSPVNSAFTVALEFSEEVSGFAATGIAVTNGTVSQFSQVDGRRFSALITPAAAGEVTVQVPANTAADAASNGNLPSNALALVYDADRPAVVLASAAPNPINRSFHVSITFTEPVTGFTAQEITVANATLSGLATADNMQYTVEVSPVADGLVTLSVAANAVQDAAGNGNTASAVLSRTFNATRPTLALSTSAANPTNAAFEVTFTFSKEVSGFEIGDIAVSNGTAAAFAQESAQVYTARITPNAEGEVIVSVTENMARDEAGNGNEAATALKLNIDKTQPAVVLASGAPEKLNSAFELTVTFSEAVTGFTGADVTVVNGTATAFAAKGDKEYSLQITPQANGEVRVSLAAGVAQDAAGNLNLASGQLIRLYDTTRPGVEVATAVTSPVNAAFTARFTFSESVESFALTDISIENGSVSNLIKESATVYTSLVTPSANGAVAVRVAENVTQDAFGNGNLASNQLSLTYDGTAPTSYAIAWSAARVDVSNLDEITLLLSGAEPGTAYTYRITSGQESTAVSGTGEVTEESLIIGNLDLEKLQDGTLTVQLYLTDKAGNKGAEVTAQVVKITRNIASVTTAGMIQVPIRTKFEQIPLSATVGVTYSTGETAQVKVSWEAGTYDGTKAGPYVLTGILELAEMTTNLDNLTAQMTVEVQPNKVPTALAFSATTFKPDATAADVIGTLSTTDPDDTEFVYALVSGEGDSHNSLFEIRGDQVYLKSNKGLSGMTSFTIRVRSTDPYLNTIERTFTLTKQAYDRTVDQLKIVNAFSPNGDGINDNWTIPELRFYNKVYIQVFDRSGVRVFETTDPEKGWDGRGPNGQILKGAFLFTVEVKDINWVKRGVVTILGK